MFCKLLSERLGNFFEFEIPKGGMAIWVKLNKQYNWKEVEVYAKQHQLEIGNWKRYNMANINHNSIRVGFASYNEEEIIDLIHRLELTMKQYQLEKSE